MKQRKFEASELGQQEASQEPLLPESSEPTYREHAITWKEHIEDELLQGMVAGEAGLKRHLAELVHETTAFRKKFPNVALDLLPVHGDLDLKNCRRFITVHSEDSGKMEAQVYVRQINETTRSVATAYAVAGGIGYNARVFFVPN